MKISPPRARPWKDMREVLNAGMSQDSFSGAVTISFTLAGSESVRLEIEHSRLRDIGQWLIQCADRQPMVKES